MASLRKFAKLLYDVSMLCEEVCQVKEKEKKKASSKRGCDQIWACSYARFPLLNAHKCLSKSMWTCLTKTKNLSDQYRVNFETYRRFAGSASGWASQVPRCTDESSELRSPAGSRPGPWCWCQQWQRSICVTTHQAQLLCIRTSFSHKLLIANFYLWS